jgi:oligoribonuclease NrnB/cAMP/cGMP phosphodiesterase (DHH superfamily)
MPNKIIIYHSDFDGVVGGWLFHKLYSDAEYCMVNYGSAIPDVKGKDTIIIDFSYDRETILKMKEESNSLVLLDHHKSAMERLGDLEYCYFDLNKSGCKIAWEYLHWGEEAPWLVNYVEDSDLWRWELYKSAELNAVISSYPLTFDSLYYLERQSWDLLVFEGMAILRYKNTIIDQIIEKSKEDIIGGVKVLTCNTPILQSAVAGKLATNKPFGCAWFENEDGDRVYSLRSTNDGIDVSEIAQKYKSGGGHVRASGFRIKSNETTEDKHIGNVYFEGQIYDLYFGIGGMASIKIHKNKAIIYSEPAKNMLDAWKKLMKWSKIHGWNIIDI